MIGLVSFKVHVLICCSTLVDKDINLEVGMFACLIYKVSLSCTNSLGSFGLTLVWCRCVSQGLVVPLISKCREFLGELWELLLEAGLVDLCWALEYYPIVIYFPKLVLNYGSLHLITNR